MSKPRWSAIPAARLSRKQLNMRVWVILGALFFAAACGLFAGIAAITRQDPPPPSIPPVAQGRGAAESVALSYVSGRPATVPLGTGIEANLGRGEDPVAIPGVSSVTWDSFTEFQQGERLIEVHRFLLAGDPPRVLDVPVEITDAGPVLAGTPALGPLALSAEPPLRFDWTDAESGLDPAGPVKRAVSEWANAYAKDDRPRLFELTGDTDTSNVYAGLGGFEVEDAEAVAAESIANSDDWVVRARVVLTGVDGFRSEAEWDLRVADAESGAPRVTAWGAAGTGGYLAPLSNAATGTTDPNNSTDDSAES